MHSTYLSCPTVRSQRLPTSEHGLPRQGQPRRPHPWEVRNAFSQAAARRDERSAPTAVPHGPTDHGKRRGSTFPAHGCRPWHHAWYGAVRGPATTATEKIAGGVEPYATGGAERPVKLTPVAVLVRL